MGFRNNNNGDDSEILGTIKKISTSPSGGKRLEVEAKFKPKVEAKSDDMAILAVPPKPKFGGSDKSETIRIDITPGDAKALEEDDQIRARIRQKYAKSKGGGGMGMGSLSDVYEHVETLGTESGDGSSGGSPWDRFKR